MEEKIMKRLFDIFNEYRELSISQDDIFFIWARALLNDEVQGDKELDGVFVSIDEKFSQVVLDVRERFSTDELKFLILNSGEFLTDEKSGGFYLEEGVRKLVDRLLDIKDGDVVLHPECNVGEYLTHFVNRYKNSSIIGGAENQNKFLKCKIKLIVAGINNSSVKSLGYNNKIIDLENFNKLFMVAPFIGGYKQKSSLEGMLLREEEKIDEWFYLVKGINDGTLEKAVILTTPDRLFNIKNLEFRKFLVDNGILEAVIELPEKLFVSTRITTNILVISKKNKYVKFIDASKICEKNRYINILDDKSIEKIIDLYNSVNYENELVSKEEIAEKKYNLLPNGYIDLFEVIHDYVYLKDVAKIKRGYANLKQDVLKDKISLEKTNIKYLTAGDIEYDMDYDKLQNLNLIKEKEEIYCVENEDIVISRGGNYKSIIIKKDEDTKVLINGSLYAISCDKEKIDPYYLQLYLASEHCKEQINGLKRGSTIPFISISNLGDIKIPKISKEEEKALGDKYRELLKARENLRREEKRLEREEQELMKMMLV